MELLRLDGISKYYRLHRSLIAGHDIVKAVDGISFSVNQGESFGIVGESGCGKSTLAQVIVMLEPATAGQIFFNGKSIHSLSRSEKRVLRRHVQIVFQDTYASLNPRFSVWETLAEPLDNFALAEPADRERRIAETLEMVCLPRDVLSRYPSELSGGERQRVCIARALVLRPHFIVFDEATSGLDVTLQSQILRLLDDLRHRLQLTYLFITHNLQILSYITDRVGVMYAGKLMEVLDSSKLTEAAHPYTRMLLAAVPVQHPKDRGKKVPAVGEQTGDAVQEGCRFFSRCPAAQETCRKQQPGLTAADHGGLVACHHHI